MANELQLDTTLVGKTIYAHLRRNSDGQWFNVSTSLFEVKLSANWINYALTMTEEDIANGGIGSYLGNMPVSLVAGFYTVVYYLQAGGTKVKTDSRIGYQTLDWNGTSDYGWYSANINGINISRTSQISLNKYNKNYNNIYYIRSDGDDTNNGLSPDKAFLTLTPAVTIAISGDLIDIGEGIFTQNSGNTIANGVSVIGKSINTSTLIFIGNTSAISFNDNCLFKNLTLSSSSGSIFSQNGINAANVRIENCKLIPGSFGSTGGGSALSISFNAVDTIILNNCIIDITGINASGGFGIGGITTSINSIIECYNCIFKGTNALTSNKPTVKTDAATIRLYNCIFETSSAIDLAQSGTGIIEVADTIYLPSKTSGIIAIRTKPDPIIIASNGFDNVKNNNVPIVTLIGYIAASTSGNVSGATGGPGTENFYATDGITLVLSIVVDNFGNRTVTYH